MTWDYFLKLAKKVGLKRAQLDRVFSLTVFAVKRHGRLNVPKFGVFVRNDKPARTVVVPGGRTADVPATWSIGFRAGRRARGRR